MPVPAPTASDSAAARFLLQAQLSATSQEIGDVQRLGYPAWLNDQMQRPISQTAIAWLQSRGYSSDDHGSETFLGDGAIWAQLTTSPDAVRKKMAYALSQIFVISLEKLPDWSNHCVSAFWDILNRHAFGNFRDLLEEVTLSAGMGYYLDMMGSEKEDAATGRHPDENYAREVMQLFTIGLVRLNNDGTVQRDAAGNPVPTYSQADVLNLARVFTGWEMDWVRYGGGDPRNSQSRRVGWSSPMRFDPAKHSTQDALFLGTRIPGSMAGPQALKAALDVLANHPNVGPFIGRQLIQRFVTSHPSAAYVGRVAARFNDNGSGVRGDLGATLRAVLLDEEARGAASLQSRTSGKVREPFLRLVQWARTFGSVPRGGQNDMMFDPTRNPQFQMGQAPFRSASVFNFYRPGYVPPATEMARMGVTAPEFQIATTNTVIAYVNVLLYAIGAGYMGRTTTPDYAQEVALAGNAAALVASLNLRLAAGQLAPATLSRIAAAVDGIPAASGSDRVKGAIALVMCAPEYLIQK